MNTFFRFTHTDLDIHGVKFSDDYCMVHPHNGLVVSSRLKSLYQGIMLTCEILLDGYKDFKHLRVHDDFFEEHKVYWLLCDVSFTHFSSQFRSFIIEKNNTDLDDLDYVLLFYASLQSSEVQNAVRGLPLSMLYDMFNPVAEDNLNKWKLATS
jgi:hypothetical protein